ncbi:MAG: hypothetical protein ABSC60_17150, partial [Acidobacteriota bacterium]
FGGLGRQPIRNSDVRRHNRILLIVSCWFQLMVVLATKMAGAAPAVFCETEKILFVAQKLLSTAENI